MSVLRRLEDRPAMSTPMPSHVAELARAAIKAMRPMLNSCIVANTIDFMPVMECTSCGDWAPTGEHLEHAEDCLYAKALTAIADYDQAVAADADAALARDP